MVTLALVAIVALGVYFYFRLDEEARRLCESALNRHCAPFTARVGAARFTPGRGVAMYDVEIVEPLPNQPARGVLLVDELAIEGDFDVASLMRGKPKIKRVVAKSPRLAATRLASGAWNLEAIRAAPAGGGGPPPAVELRNATIVLAHEHDAGQSLAVHHLDLSAAPSVADPARIEFTASARDTVAKKLLCRGDAAVDGSSCKVRFDASGVQLDHSLAARLASFGLKSLRAVPVRGSLAAEGALSIEQGRLADWRVAARLEGGEVQAPGVRRPLTDVSLAATATPDALRIDDANAQWGDSTIRLAGRRSGWSIFSPLAVRLRVTEVDVASIPVAMLPSDARRHWERFRPAGRADITADVVFDGRRWSPSATVDLREGSFEDSERFAYRVTGARGQLRLNGGVSGDPTPRPTPEGEATLDLDLMANAEGAPIRIAAALHGMGKRRRADEPRPMMPLGWIDISGSGVPTSPKLISAITEDPARRFVESLHPVGRVDVRWRADRLDPSELKPRIALDLRLVDCQVRYDRFPYPLSGVTGWVRQRGRRWDFSELRSLDARGRPLVVGSGSLVPEAEGHRLRLQFRGEAAPLDQTLFAALPENAQKAWALLRPRGQINFVADISRPPGAVEPTVRLTMDPHERSVAIEPALSSNGYRYRLERLDGRFLWGADRLVIERARAEHGRTSFQTDGEWEALPTGGWALRLRGLHADRMAFNRDFMLAAPEGLRGVIEELNPRGGLDLFDSRLEITQRADPSSTVEAAWQLGVSCHQVSLDCGIPIEAISGVVRLQGRSDGASAFTAGELDLESLFWNDLQLTSVRGPLWADATDFFLGEGVAERLGGDRRRVTAEAYGGEVAANSWVRHGGGVRYGAQFNLRDVDVARLSTEWLGRTETLQGDLEGSLELQGGGLSIYGLQGSGQMAINDADLYELPVLVSLLKTLRNRTPDKTAFNRVEAKFDLRGDEFRFANLDLLGDAISLYGKGTANFDRTVDLTFASIVGRNDLAVPILRSFVSSASEQLLRLEVEGPIDNPTIRRNMLPLVGNVLEQLQGELGPRATATAPRPPEAARR